MKKNEVTIKSKQEAGVVAEMLTELADNFKKGKVVIQKGGSFVAMKPAGLIEMEIEASEKKGKQKIEIQLTWKEDILQDAKEAELIISAEEPIVDLMEASADETSEKADTADE